MVRIDLHVSFSEKNQVKSLGAKWDSVNRVWYIESTNPNLSELTKWIPEDSAVAIPNTSLVEKPEINASSLSIHLQKVRNTIRKQFDDSDWIVADIVKITNNNGNYYLELAEYDNNQTIVAKCRANIWSSNANNLKQKFKVGTGSELSQDIKVMLKVSTQFDPAYGFTLVVQDIDPNYTIGAAEANLRQIRDTLVRVRLYDVNKRVGPPDDYFRVAVISPKEAAGLEDFRRDALMLQQKNICHFDYFTATFQGPKAVNEIDDAINQVRSSHQESPYDVLCIIRGGGSKSDLDWLNNEILARQVCTAPLPVFTGIGHSTDSTILDEVACKAHDTPSKVIKFIESSILNNANTAQTNFETIHKAANNFVINSETRFKQLKDQIAFKVSNRMLNAENACDALRNGLFSDIKVTISEASKKPDMYFTEIKDKSHAILNNALIKTSTLNLNIKNMAESKITAINQDLIYRITEINSNTLRRVKDGQTSADRWIMEISTNAKSMIKKADEMSSLSYKNIFAMGTNPTLKRGFTITRSGNKPASKLINIDRTAPLEIEFQDGKINVVVKE